MRSLALSPRRGKTLIEMLVLISVLSAILSVVAMTLVALFKTDRQILRDLDQATALARLSGKFRSDAHAASSCQIGQSCQLALPDGRVIHYLAAPREIAREIRRGEVVEHRDAFLLPSAAAVRFELPAESAGRLVRLSIAAAPDSDRAYLTAIRPAVIEAAVGLSKSQPERVALP